MIDITNMYFNYITKSIIIQVKKGKRFNLHKVVKIL